MDPFFYLIIAAGALAGGSTGLLGVYVVGMRIPFIGTCVSHAAMAGAVLGALLGVNSMVTAVAAAVVTAGTLALIRPDRGRMESNVAMAILFSLMLGLTFLGIGLNHGSRNEMLSMLWGSLLFVREETVVVITGLAMVLILFVIVFDKELRAILFSRSIAAATGVHEGLVYGLFLMLCGLIVAVNLQAIGGVLIFCLITNPAAAAYQVFRGYRAVVLGSVVLGAVSAVGGFIASYYLNLPTGACIVLASCMIFGLSVMIRRWLLSDS